MAKHIATVSSKGQFVIPSEMRDALNIHPGTRAAVSRRENQIILQLVNDQFVKGIRGITAGGASMSNMLIKERRREDLKSKW